MQVFSADWFTANQDRLLRFANGAYGRRLLRIHGQRSDVGKRRITRIEPHAITWRNVDGSYSTEFRTHAKYAKRLYHGLRPVWQLMHAWDVGVANKLNPELLNLGFDTLTAFPQAGNGTLTTDSYAGRFIDDPGETFTTILSGVGTDADPTDSLYAWVASRGTTNKFGIVARSIMTFNTSSIPTASTVTAATVSLVLLDKYAGLGQTAMHITGATPNQNTTISPADYQRLGSTSFASLAYTSINYSGYMDFSLNSSGISSVVRGGVSAFGGRLGWDIAGSFTGTWASFEDSYYEWTPADNAATDEDPKLTVTYTAARPTAVSGTVLLGGTVTPKTTHKVSISGTLLLGGAVTVNKNPAPVAGKQYVYRIYKADGSYVGIWPDVTDDLEFTQRLNTPGTTTTVYLGRSANNTKEQRDALVDTTSDPYTDQSTDPYVVVSNTPNSVGTDTDVDLNYRVDVYVHYGGFDSLVTQAGEPYVTDAGEEYLVSFGAPLGRRVFSGVILDYNSVYTAEREYVEVTLASNGIELSREVIRSGTTTTVTYSSQTHDTIIKSILDTNPGRMSYTAATISGTGVSITQALPLNTKLEGINAVYNQSDPGWYWYGHPGENNVYFKNMSAAADHTFYLGKHVQGLELRKSAEKIVNTIYFVGGDTGSGVLYKKYVDATSVAAYGTRIYRITDRRFTLAASAQRYAAKVLARYSQPIYTTTLKIPSEVYDIESIDLGQVVAFRNFNNFVDSLLLQVVSKSYSPYLVTLELGELLDTQRDVISDVSDDLQNEQFNSIPTAPS